jgi:hypothetical protein
VLHLNSPALVLSCATDGVAAPMSPMTINSGKVIFDMSFLSCCDEVNVMLLAGTPEYYIPAL